MLKGFSLWWSWYLQGEGGYKRVTTKNMKNQKSKNKKNKKNRKKYRRWEKWKIESFNYQKNWVTPSECLTCVHCSVLADTIIEIRNKHWEKIPILEIFVNIY